jgi:hypothetical protein
MADATPLRQAEPAHYVVLDESVYVVHLGAASEAYRPNPRHCRRLRAEVERFEYSGNAMALVALGVASEEMLGRRRPGSAKFDGEGYRCSVVRSWREGEDGQPYQHYRVTRQRPVDRIGELPGSREAILAMRSHREFQEAMMAAARAEAEERAAWRQRPRLRLVVDNTL